MIEAPAPWTRFDEHGARPFTTLARFRRADGGIVTWESRLYRKHHNLLDNHRGTTWWAPGAIGWWIGVLFMVGSACFALGATPGYLGAVGVDADGVTYFVGSVFFTSAAFLQYLEMVNTPVIDAAGVVPGRIRFLLWQPLRIDWWASSVQLVGTLFFNLSTAHALLSNLDARQVDQLVWRPDAFGSVCFLVASGFAWAEAGHRWFSWRPSEPLVVDRGPEPRRFRRVRRVGDRGLRHRRQRDARQRRARERGHVRRRRLLPRRCVPPSAGAHASD